jgi:hypothetical protein
MGPANQYLLGSHRDAEAGEAAEFATVTPHALAALDGPAELIMIFDRDGQRAHIDHEAGGHPAPRPAADDA